MFLSRFVLPVIALASVLCVLTACGGGTAGSFDSALDTPDNSFVGITDGDFKAVRFNEAGIRDAAMNSTIGFTTRRTGDFTEVTITVNDVGPMLDVLIDLNYDANRYHPVGSEFHGLIDSPIEAYIPNTVGLVGLGQVAFEEATRSGDFATVRFADGPGTALRSASILHLGDVNAVYGSNVPDTMLDSANDAQGFAVVANGADWDVTINSIYAQADGNDDGETNLADLTPLSSHGNYQIPVANDNFGPAASDYDGNGEPNLADISNLALNFSAITNHLEIWLSDNADMSGGTMHASLPFADGTASFRAGDPAYVTDSWTTVWRTWTNTITAADITAADTNADGTVYVSALNADNDASGTLFSPSIELGGGTPASNVAATGVTVTMDGNPVAGGGVAEVTANGVSAWDILDIAGTYNDGSGDVTFAAGDPTGLVPVDDYATALAAVKTHSTWTVTNRTGDDFQSTGNALVFASGTGAPVDATAFPDWDEESTAATTPEGSLELTFAAGGGTLTAGLGTTTIGIDVIKDDTAPEVDPLMAGGLGQDGDGNWILNTVGETTISGPIIWGAAPASDDTVTVQLYNYINVGDANNVNFDYTTDNPPAAGFFTLAGPSSDLLVITTAPVPPGSEYGLRVSNGDPGADPATGVWSSINWPGDWYATSAIEPKVAFVMVPDPNLIGPGTKAITVLYPDPQIRRDPTITWNDLGGTFGPADEPASMDFLKGEEGTSQFPLAYEGANDRSPRLVLIELMAPGDSKDDIFPDTLTMAGPQLYQDGMSSNKMVIDIEPITSFTPGMGDPKRYAFKLYGTFDSEVGWGEFSVQRMTLSPASPAGLQWGINVFDVGGRGAADYATSDWENHILDSSRVGSNVPDVMFIEFTGGQLGDYPSTPGDDNVFITLFGTRSMNILADVRAAGLDTDGVGFIAVYEFVAADFFDGVTGTLAKGQSWVVQLDDPSVAGTPDFQWDQPGDPMLTVINDPPPG